MVHAAKALAMNMASAEKANDWRTKNNLVSLFQSVFEVLRGKFRVKVGRNVNKV